jgi:hypothetical protein
MFSPIGTKKYMLQNYLRSKQTGKPVEEISVTPVKVLQTAAHRARLPSFVSFEESPRQSDDEPEEERAVSRGGSVRCGLSKSAVKNLLETEGGDDGSSIALYGALSKVYSIVGNFRRDRDSELIAPFESKSMEANAFRGMAKRVFNIDFSEDEFSALKDIFCSSDRKGINGSEFLVCFTHLTSIHKKNQESIIRRQQEQLRARERRQEEERRAVYDPNLRPQIAPEAFQSFSASDSETAMEKLRVGAKNYDKGHPAAKSLNGFDAAFLDPASFRDVVFKTFNVKLTPGEVGAIAKDYPSGSEGNIDTHKFLKFFLKLGQNLRMADHSHQLQENRQGIAALEQEQVRRLQEQERRLALGIDADFTPEDEASGLQKISQAAIKFDKLHPSSLSLDGFNAIKTPPGLFREMLKRTFNVLLTPKELGAVVKHFDVDNSNEVDNKSFLNFFSRASTTGKFAIRSESIARCRKAIEDAEAEREAKLAQSWKQLTDAEKYTFSEEDRNSAERKFIELAKAYFGDKASQITFAPFRVRSMEPVIWREMMRRSFGVKFNNGELAYFLTLFGDKDGNIDCVQFNMKFKSLVFEEKSKLRAQQLKLIRDSKAKVEADKKAKVEKRIKMYEELISHDFSEGDTESVVEKLSEAAVRYDKNHPAAPSMSAFHAAYMPAAEFQDLMKRLFHINMTNKELGALVALCGKRQDLSDGESDSPLASRGNVSSRRFDPAFTRALSSDNVGLNNRRVPNQSIIDCTRFMVIFSYLQRVCKNQVRSNRVQLLREVRQLQDQESSVRSRENDEVMAKALAFEDSDIETLMVKLNEAAQKFCIDNGAYLEYFQPLKGPCKTPAALRDIFYRAFLIRLTLPEIGALIHYINPELEREHLVNGNKFLTSFMKLSRIHENILLGLPPSEPVDDIKVLVPLKPLSQAMLTKQQASFDRSKRAEAERRQSSGNLDDETKRSMGVNTDDLFKIPEDFFEIESIAPHSRKSVKEKTTAIPKKKANAPAPESKLPRISGSQSPSMLASMFRGVNPWTASEEELRTLGFPSASK